MARPRKDIDPEQVEKLAALHCTHAEIASVLGCDRRTLERRFASNIERGKENGRAKLRQMQWRAAMQGNVKMLIWLGKQMLGQADRKELTGRDGEALIPRPESVRDAAARAAELIRLGLKRAETEAVPPADDEDASPIVH